MRTLLVIVILLVVGIAGLGFYRGWFQVSSDRDTTDQTVNTTLTVDEDRIREDKEKLQEFGQQAKEETAEVVDESE